MNRIELAKTAYEVAKENYEIARNMHMKNYADSFLKTLADESFSRMKSAQRVYEFYKNAK